MERGSAVRMLGIGRYLPRRIVGNEELAARLGVGAAWIGQRTGVQRRHWAERGVETNSSMAAEACREAVADAGLSLADIDLILNASGTPEQVIPDGGALLQRELGLGATGVMAMSVHTTCLSFIAALDTAAAFLETGRFRHILISSSEIGSAGLDFSRPEVAALFGDGAAAVVLGLAEGQGSRLERVRFETFGDGAHLTQIPGGGTRQHPNLEGRDPRDCLFQMEGIPTLRLCRRVGPAFVEALFDGYTWGHGEDGITWVVPHQSSRAGLHTMKTLGIPEDRALRTLDHLGNCIAASIPLTLYEAVRAGRIQRGTRVVLLGTGAGLSLGGAILVF